MSEQLLARFPRVGLSVLPTPLHRLARVLPAAGCSLYCKRDDLTGFAFGGNKTRKLDFLIGEALAQGCDTVLALGANQSNFCRMASAAATAHGLVPHLVLGGGTPARATGNLLLDHLFGAVIHHINSTDWDAWVNAGQELQRELEQRSNKVYWLPVGGSTPTGALGYVAGFFEIMADAARLGVTFDAIVHASSSAGTQAGLTVGKALTGWPGEIIGIAAAKDRATLAREVRELADRVILKLEADADPGPITVDDMYLGEAYAAETPGCRAAIKLFAEREGILLDTVYSGKAAAGLIDYARHGRFSRGQKILFLHTGGTIELFA